LGYSTRSTIWNVLPLRAEMRRDPVGDLRTYRNVWQKEKDGTTTFGDSAERAIRLVTFERNGNALRPRQISRKQTEGKERY